VAELLLEVRDFAGPDRWRWVLTDASGTFLADHEVRLDAASWQYEAFGDLRWYLQWHSAPDRRAEDEARIVAEVGAWIGSQVLGPAVAAALGERRPATVRVIVAPPAVDLLYRPLELAHANGKPLAVQDVTLVMEATPGGPAIEPVGERLRVLGLFSLPEGGRPLNLRRERAELVRLVRGIAATGRAANVRVLQYGVTRDRLRDVLEEAEGWDIIHVAGHGAPGSLTLETASGSPDRVTAADLVGLLDPARGRLKLVTVSACWSAAVLANEQRRLLGLPARNQDQDDPAERDRGDGSPSTSSGALASELADQLGCAVLAMRYPVGDDFAIALSGKLYGLLAEKGQPLPRAVGMTLRELSATAGGTGASGGPFPALSMATPALFGGRAADLRLAAPPRDGPASYDTAPLKMAGFPPEPARLVGRTGMLARASAALAVESGVPGVLLHGMPGGGKTACALELAYGHEEAFDRLAWYKAPDEGMAIDGALAGFALALERYLPGFQMVDALVSADALASLLPRLTELLARRRVLMVIDNAESLLSDDGSWRDDRWRLVIGALIGHSGPGRVILTSRRLPAAVLPGVLAEPVDALSADEALLLARELPNLSALKLGAVPGVGPAVSRQLARNAIAMAQGHPKLLELAEGQAAHPDQLLSLVKTGDQEWRKRGGVPEGFFASGASSASREDYLHLLAAWTMAVTDTLGPAERDLFWLLCCLEERDRQRVVLDDNWAGLRQALGRDGHPQDADQALAAIAARGLTAIQAESDETDELYAIHPMVAEAGRAQAGMSFRDTVDIQIAGYWHRMHRYASGENAEGSVHTRLLVRAGLSAVPYGLRQQFWEGAAVLLGNAFLRDPSRANAAAVLPTIQQITRHHPRAAGVLATVLEMIDPTAAENMLRAALADAITRGDYWSASVIAARLTYLCLGSGRFVEALHLTEQTAGYTELAGMGPWAQLGDAARRLQVLGEMGQASQVLAEVGRLRARMDTLPATPATDGRAEAILPWTAREMLLDAGRNASRQLGRWPEALELNAAILASMSDRRAPAAEIARARFNDYGPLLHLGRTDEALALLLDCRQVFEDAQDAGMLGAILGALAHTEYQRGHGDAAVRLERDALRYRYLTGDVAGIALSYHNLGNSLAEHARQPGPALASHLAAALIEAITGSGGSINPVGAAAADLRELGGGGAPPRDIADLGDRLADIPGTDLPGLITRLCPDPQAAEQTLRDLITRVQAIAAQPIAAQPPPAASAGEMDNPRQE
jgi:hypothetical protein